MCEDSGAFVSLGPVRSLLNSSRARARRGRRFAESLLDLVVRGFRRFSDIGYQRFLSRRFAHNLKLSDLRYGRLARLVRAMGLGVPYCLQGGPTYASTNDPEVFKRLEELKKEKSRG